MLDNFILIPLLRSGVLMYDSHKITDGGKKDQESISTWKMKMDRRGFIQFVHQNISAS